MKVKELFYGNTIWKIKILILELSKNRKFKKWRNVWKYNLPELDYENLTMKQTLSILELESIN